MLSHPTHPRTMSGWRLTKEWTASVQGDQRVLRSNNLTSPAAEATVPIFFLLHAFPSAPAVYITHGPSVKDCAKVMLAEPQHLSQNGQGKAALPVCCCFPLPSSSPHSMLRTHTSLTPKFSSLDPIYFLPSPHFLRFT